MSNEQHRKPPEGHVYIVTGTPVKADRSKISLPIFTREIVVMPNGLRAVQAFTSGIQQHESRFILRLCHQLIGDIEFEQAGFNFEIEREERWMTMSPNDAMSEIESVAKTPASVVEESISMALVRSLRRRKLTLTAGA